MSPLKTLLSQSRRTVFLGGAGVSTASGIPDFRSAHGLYMEKKQGIPYVHGRRDTAPATYRGKA